MYFIKHKLAIAGAVLSVVMSAAVLGNSLIYAFSEDYKNWKQYGSSWSSMYLGTSSDTIAQSGCAVTAAAILMVHSGSVTNEDFNPGVMVDFLNQNGGLNSYGILDWYALSDYVPDFKYVSNVDNRLYGSNQAEKAQELKKFLDEGYYVIVKISNGNNMHFVAVDSVNGSRVTMMDPGSSKTSLFDKYPADTVTQVRLFTGKNSRNISGTEADEPEQIPTEPQEIQLAAPETAPVTPETVPPETTTVSETTVTETTTTAVTTTESTEAPVTTTETSSTTAVTTTAAAVTTAETTTTAVTTTTAAPVTTKQTTTTEIFIMTKPADEIPVTVVPESDEPAEELHPEALIDPVSIELDEEDNIIEPGTVEFVVLQDAPETAPSSAELPSADIPKTKTLYIPEEQAEAKLVEIKEQHIFMSIRFTVKENLNLRQNPDTDSDILTVIPANTSLNVVETDEDFKWGKVLYNGCEGWIALNFAAL